jgi:hypothetical protein
MTTPTSASVDVEVASAAQDATKVYSEGATAVRALDEVTIGFPTGQFVSNTRFKAATGSSPHYPSAREAWAVTVAALTTGPPALQEA